MIDAAAGQSTVQHAAADVAQGLVTILTSPKKKNPAVGTPGQSFFLIGVYGFSMRPGWCS
jgi:hypothetical protein